MKVILIFALFSLIVIQLNGQTIIGKIVDSSNAEPLVYASVGIIGTPIGTITDENGNFKINVTGQPLKAILRVSMISYKPETFTIDANGRNYMQLGIAGFVPVKPRCRCCGLRTFLSAPKPQLTYSFCVRPA